jgi:hypothetical protein
MILFNVYYSTLMSLFNVGFIEEKNTRKGVCHLP